MAQVLVRDLPEETVARLKSKAAEAGRRLEAELRDIRARSRPWQPGEPTAADMIREDRDSR